MRARTRAEKSAESGIYPATKRAAGGEPLSATAPSVSTKSTLNTAADMLEVATLHLGRIVVAAQNVRGEAEAGGRAAKRADNTEAAAVLGVMYPYLDSVAESLFAQSALALEAVLAARDEVLDVVRQGGAP